MVRTMAKDQKPEQDAERTLKRMMPRKDRSTGILRPVPHMASCPS